MNSSDLEWNDLRLVLIIARAGTLSGAARILHQSHATMFRQLAKAEKRLGVRLFERSRTGYKMTAAGEDAFATATRIEAEVNGLARHIVGQDLAHAGKISITTTDSLFEYLLAPVIAEYIAKNPQIDLDIILSNDVLSLNDREADLAIRPTSTPADMLIGRKVATIELAVFGHVKLLPTDIDVWENPSAHWIGPDDDMAYPQMLDWMETEGLKKRCRVRTNSMLAMHKAVREKIGFAALPTYIGDNDPVLRRYSQDIEALRTDLWVLIHPALRNTARVRSFSDFIYIALKHNHVSSALSPYSKRERR